MLDAPRNQFRAAAQYQPLLRALGLGPDTVFSHPDIKVWRKLEDRENCTIDADLPDGRHVRLHIKRYQPARGFTTAADDEARGLQALQIENIPTSPLVGWGKLLDGRSFVITDDLAGYVAGDKAVTDAATFERWLTPTAQLAARLHGAGLHHRDLYLCHFFVKPDGLPTNLRLIDAARVRRLPGWPLRTRWIVKDVAQFIYSTTKAGVTDEQRGRWLAAYTLARGTKASSIERQVMKKVAWIARHDERLNRQQPNRNVSIPR